MAHEPSEFDIALVKKIIGQLGPKAAKEFISGEGDHIVSLSSAELERVKGGLLWPTIRALSLSLWDANDIYTKEYDA